MAHQMFSIHSLLFWWLTFDWFNHLIARCDMGKGLLLEGRKHPIQLTFAIFKKAMVSLSIIQFCDNVDLRKQSLFFFPGFEGQICSELLRPDADVPRPPSLYHFSPLCALACRGSLWRVMGSICGISLWILTPLQTNIRKSDKWYQLVDGVTPNEFGIT